MFEKNLAADMNPPTLPVPAAASDNASPVDWLGIYNQHHQVGTWELHVPTRRLTWSAETYRIHGIDPKDTTIPLKGALALFHPQDIAKIEQLMAQAIRTKRGFRYKLRLNRPDKQTRIIESIASVRLNAEGEVERILGVCKDITAEVEHENTRVGQTDLLLRMVRTMPAGAALLDRELRYLAWSARWLTDMGMPGEYDLAGKMHFDVFPEIGPDKHVITEVVMKGQALSKEREKIQRPNGVAVILDWVAQPWQDRYGDIGGVVMLTRVHYVAPPKQAQVEAQPQPAEAALAGLLNASA